MLRIRPEAPHEAPAREALLDAAFGPSRFAKTCERLREGRLPAEGLSFVASEDLSAPLAADPARAGGRILGTVRLWDVSAGAGRPALMLGPLAVAAEARSLGLGATLMRVALSEAQALGHEAVILVGDAPYYARFGFRADVTAGLWLPGAYDPARFLGLELREGALRDARGLVAATGREALSEARKAAEAAFAAEARGLRRAA